MGRLEYSNPWGYVDVRLDPLLRVAFGSVVGLTGVMQPSFTTPRAISQHRNQREIWDAHS
jgi:hypothetical protein